MTPPMPGNPPTDPPADPPTAPPTDGPVVRPVHADDLPTLRPWWRPGADTTWPPPTDAGAPAARAHWLLAEQDGAPQACARLLPAIGLDAPRPWYHVGCVVHAAPALQRVLRQRTLLLGHDHTGAAELADMAWRRDGRTPAQQTLALRALVRAALKLLRAGPNPAVQHLIAELPGLRDANGHSPFWLGLGRHFFAGDPTEVARRFGPSWRGHVAALLPRQTVYTAFLPDAAQAAIAQVHPDALVLRDALWHEGLRDSQHITIDDGGPVFALALDLPPAGPAT